MDGATQDRFGVSVALDGAAAVVGAFLDDDLGDMSGSAYVFGRDVGGADAWGQVAKLTAADGASSDQFGASVAISGDAVAVGASEDDDVGDQSGSVYLFRTTGVDPRFELAGTCPGEANLTASLTTPRGSIRLLGALSAGNATVPTGPCAGTEIGLDDATSLLSSRADADGGKFTVRNIPESWCGGFVQLLDETCCAVSDVVPESLP